MTSGSGEKTCVICKEDCSQRPRIKDRQGRYYCKSCHADAALRRSERAQHSTASGQEPLAQPEAQIRVTEGRSQRPDDAAKETADTQPDIGYGLIEEIIKQPPPGSSASNTSGESDLTGSTQLCPSCDTPLPGNTKICISCGINIETGRSIVMSRGVDENIVYHNAERVLRPLSWIMSFGFSPVASEAMGTRKPYLTWGILALTCIVSLWFWFSSSTQMQHRKNLMLWSGQEKPDAELIISMYEWTDYGDYRAFENAFTEFEKENDSRSGSIKDSEDALILSVHNSLTAQQQTLGSFHFVQLLTHALLHADIFHLAGNMVFLIIFGSRVNALIGNIATAILYPILAILAAWAQMMSSINEMPIAMLGASGAIMGLAGMYFVFFPLNRMHVSVWFRFLFFFRMKVWPLRGFWVVLFYIAWDIFYISTNAETGTAHWAHLGGFIAGMVLALGLIFSQCLYAGGTDLISTILGRRAWALLGRPGDRKTLGFSWPGNRSSTDDMKS